MRSYKSYFRSNSITAFEWRNSLNKSIRAVVSSQSPQGPPNRLLIMTVVMCAGYSMYRESSRRQLQCTLCMNFCYKIEHPFSSDSLSKPSSFSISFIRIWNTSATFSPVLLEHSRYGTPIDSANACASCHHHSRSSTRRPNQSYNMYDIQK